MGARLIAVGRLLRLSLLPSAVADALCGLALANGGFPGAGTLLAVGASAGLFHGGMALNDWADREEDGRVRPSRPIPSGQVSALWALALAVTLLLGGVACAASVSVQAGALAVGVAALVVLYDTVGRGPLVGPLLLAGCRAGNLALAASIGAGLVGAELVPVRAAAPCLLYGAYVFVVSRLGRLEDDLEREPGSRPRPLLLALGALLFAAPLAALPAADGASISFAAAFVVTLAASHALVREARARDEWTRAEVVRAMGLALRRLVALTGALAFAAGAPLLGAAILATFPVGVALRRVFPPS